MVEVPVGIELVVLTVMIEVPEPVNDEGLKLVRAPDGPLALRTTVPLNPFCGDTVTAYAVVCPGFTVWDGGLTERLKFGAFEMYQIVSVSFG
jgi:hypothetical protein